MNSLIDVLKSPSVWTGKDGVNTVTDLLKNPPLQDKIQLGLIKSSYDTLVQTGQIVIPGTDKKAPVGQLYNAAANAGKSLVSATAGLVSAPKELSNLPTAGLNNIAGAVGGAVGQVTGAVGALSGAAGSAVKNITNNLPNVSSLANRGTAELGGLLATASKFGVGTTVDWAKGAAGNLASGTKGAMDSLAKQGQFAVNFSDFKLPAAVAGIIPAAGFKGTINRSTLNAATAKLIGSEKIPLPNFSPQSINTSALTEAANKAKSVLTGGLNASGFVANRLPGAIAGDDAVSSLLSSVPSAKSRLRIADGLRIPTIAGVAASSAAFVAGPGPDPNDRRDARNTFAPDLTVRPGGYIPGPYGPIYVAPGAEPPGAVFVAGPVPTEREPGRVANPGPITVPLPSDPYRPPQTEAERIAAKAATRELLNKYGLDSVVADGTAGGNTGAFTVIDGRSYLILPDGRTVPI